ncbi:hypothetical protein HDZ31DRAFT_84777 [Schizophyllum fasciatum]
MTPATNSSDDCLGTTAPAQTDGQFTDPFGVIAHLDKTSVNIVGIISTLFPNDAFTVDPRAVARTLYGNLYNSGTRTWPSFPSPSLHSDAVAFARGITCLLNAVARQCRLAYATHSAPLLGTKRRWIISESSRLLSNGEEVQSVGVVLVDTDSDDVQWSDVLCDIQVASHADDMPHALQRLSSGAATVFATQEDRLYHIGVVFAGDTLQLAYFDRAGRVLSGTYHVHSNPKLLVRIVMGLSLLDKSYGGKDTSIITRDARRFVTVAGVEYEIMNTVSLNRRMVSRGTICWHCRRSDSEEDFVIKHTWANKQLHTTEGEFLAKAAGIDGVAELVCEEVVLRRDGSPQDTLWLREVLQGSERLAFVGHCPMLELRRLVMRPYARSLEEFASKDELLVVFIDTIEAHLELYEQREILHCDISDNNILLRRSRAMSHRLGLLVDLDCATFVSGLEGVAPMGRKRGTLPFMAYELLLPTHCVSQGPWHDLESFLYVLMFICTNYSGPSNTPREGFDLDKSPMAQFRKFLDASLVCELRSVITRTPDGTKADHIVVLDVLKDFRDERARARGHAATAAGRKDESPSPGSDRSGKRKRPLEDEPSGDDIVEDTKSSLPSSPSHSSNGSGGASESSEGSLAHSQESSEGSRSDRAEGCIAGKGGESVAPPMARPAKRRRFDWLLSFLPL